AQLRARADRGARIGVEPLELARRVEAGEARVQVEQPVARAGLRRRVGGAHLAGAAEAGEPHAVARPGGAAAWRAASIANGGSTAAATVSTNHVVPASVPSISPWT